MSMTGGLVAKLCARKETPRRRVLIDVGGRSGLSGVRWQAGQEPFSGTNGWALYPLKCNRRGGGYKGRTKSESKSESEGTQ